MRENTQFLKNLENDLKKIPVLSPRAEAELLMRHYGRMSRLDFFLGENKISSSAKAAISRAIQKRRRGLPLAYVTQKAPFWGYDFSVGKGVLIPRPETERLVEEALKVLRHNNPGGCPQILDLGTGSGCIAVCLTLEWPDCRMTALDTSPKALEIARKNIELFGLGHKIKLVKSRFFEAFKRAKKAQLVGNKWDMIISNPPYIPTGEIKDLSSEVQNEPRIALDGGSNGLRALNKILKEAPKFLRPGGYLLMEIGDGQSEKLKALWKTQPDYESFYFEKDLNGIERILIARKNTMMKSHNVKTSQRQNVTTSKGHKVTRETCV